MALRYYKVNHQHDYPADYLADILAEVKTIAMVGASPDKTKFSYGVLRVLHETGYDMIPVNPNLAGQEIRGMPVVAGLHDIDPTRGPRFTMENMAVQAALDGHGVALIGDILVADDLAAGRLVRPFDPSLSTPLTFSYYLLSAKDSAEQPKVAAFRDWLLEEVRASRPEACEEP